MNYKKYSLIASTLLVILSSCEKQGAEIPGIASEDKASFFVNAEEPVFMCEHDVQLSELAKAISRASRDNAGLRTMIKEECLKRFDGDVDFLITKAIEKPVFVEDEMIATKGLSGLQTFGSLISHYIEDPVKSGESILETIQSEYPNLQVAVPVHVEDWDAEDYIPIVAFIPEDYHDMVTETVPGYDAEGNYVEVDALHEPDVPVIVISHNERMELVEEEEQSPGRSITAPQSPTGLTATISSTANILSWNYASSCTGFSIWRHGPSDAGFIEITRVSSTDLGYYDTSIVAQSPYQYYVKAYNTSDEGLVYSTPSNTVSLISPSVLSPLASFGVAPSGTNLRFSWSSGDTNSSIVYIMEKGPNDSDYHTLTSRPSYYSYCMNTPSDRGECHEYMAYRSNALGPSESLSTFIYPPYRNASQTSHTYTRKLTIRNNLDGWLFGAPEFFMDVFALTSGGSVEKINRVWMYFTDGYKDKSESFTNKNAHDWVLVNPANEWYKSVLFWLFEKDDGSSITLNSTFSLAAKIAELLDLGSGVGFSTTVKDDDDDCGSVMLYYFDDPEMTLEFPNYGARLRISESGSGTL